MERLQERALELSIKVAKAYLDKEGAGNDAMSHIFWENRRYEIAKSALQGILSNGLVPEERLSFQAAAHSAVLYADALISELTK